MGQRGGQEREQGAASQSFFPRGKGWSSNTCLGMGMWRPDICARGTQGMRWGTGGAGRGAAGQSRGTVGSRPLWRIPSGSPPLGGQPRPLVGLDARAAPWEGLGAWCPARSCRLWPCPRTPSLLLGTLGSSRGPAGASRPQNGGRGALSVQKHEPLYVLVAGCRSPQRAGKKW